MRILIYPFTHRKSGSHKKARECFNLIFADEGSEILASILDEAELRYKVPEDIHNALSMICP